MNLDGESGRLTSSRDVHWCSNVAMTRIRRLSAIKPQCKHYQAGKQWNNIDAISLPSEVPCVFFLGGGHNSSVFPEVCQWIFRDHQVGLISKRLGHMLVETKRIKPRNARGETRGCFLVENCLKPGTGSSGWCLKNLKSQQQFEVRVSLSSLRTSCSTTTIKKNFDLTYPSSHYHGSVTNRRISNSSFLFIWGSFSLPWLWEKG